MTDKALLEKAAKAAGCKYTNLDVDTVFWVSNDDCFWEPWNPLTDDGDALRLAVKLGLAISIDQVELMTHAHHEEAWKGSIEKWYCHPTSKDGSQDAYAATRRAIVRAAAAIGEKE